MKLTFDNIKDFDDFEQWLKNKSDNYSALEKKYQGLLEHSKELEAENYELQMENRRKENEKEALLNKVQDLEEQIKNATAENSDE